MEGTTHFRFLEELEKHMEHQWYFQQTQVLSRGCRERYDVLTNLTLESKISNLMAENT